MRVARKLVIALVALAAGCRGASSQPELDAAAPDPAPGGSPGSAQPAFPAPSHDLIANLHTCQIRHRGLSIDLGTRADKALRGHRIGPFEDASDVRRGGATFTRILARRVAYDFWLDRPLSGLFVSARVHGGSARTLSITIDERRLGGFKLTERETRVVSTAPLGVELPAGRHSLGLSFSGPADPARGFAEVDWIRIGEEDELPTTYAAPTREDIVSDIALDGVPRRSLVLRPPGTVSCAIRPAPDARLRVALGFWGAGRGVAEIALRFDGKDPVRLTERKIAGGSGATWTLIDLELGSHASEVVALELTAVESSKGGRIVFGDPAIVRGEAWIPRVPPARTAIVIVLAGLDRSQLPPWGPTGGLTAVGELARRSAAFSGYRVPSTVTGAVMASLLSGLPPRAHALEDPAARLPRPVRTLSEMVKEAGGRTAMFSGVPTTSAAFGFDTAWDVFRSFSPVEDVSATEPFHEASKWLDRELTDPDAPRRLLVVHARGVRPPWDLNRDEVAKLPPEEYGGPLDARRGGIALASVRARRVRAHRKLEDADWTRLRALERAALAKQNDGVARLWALLDRHSAWDDTLIVLAGDVGPGEPPEPPFDPAGPLSEDRLLVPLLVKFPKGQFAAKEVATGAAPIDLARTLLEALGVAVPAEIVAEDLYQAAAGSEPLTGRPSVAVMGERYATRIGSLLLRGEFGRLPKLCRLDVDPACQGDVFTQMPITSRALWQWTHDWEARARELRRAPREPASIDPPTSAALTVWGDL
jgi:arylsulfatase A-like enzyme